MWSVLALGVIGRGDINVEERGWWRGGGDMKSYSSWNKLIIYGRQDWVNKYEYKMILNIKGKEYKGECI